MSFLSNNNDRLEEKSLRRIIAEKASGKLGIALVGLGNYSGMMLGPALQQTDHCYLAGIVTGHPEKTSKWKKQYLIPDANIYDYSTFDQVKNNPDIDIIYIVLPNSMHAEYGIRTAKAGKHLISEKPLANSVEDCDKLIAACKKANKLFSVGYRLHFEPYNLEMARLGQQKIYGTVKKMSAGFGFPVGDPAQWRLKKNMAGGGPLVDIGIYCIQAFCYVTGAEPIAVTAQEGPKTDQEKFKEVEESVTWQFEFPGRCIAEGHCSYSKNMNWIRAEAEKGWFELKSAFHYTGQKGATSDGLMNFPLINHQAKQMDDFALAIKNNRPTSVPGEMGRRDIKLIKAIYEAMQTGKRIEIS